MKKINQLLFKAAVFTVTTFFFVFGAFALNSSGIGQAVADVSSFMDTAFNLVIAIESLIGLIGSQRFPAQSRVQSCSKTRAKRLQRGNG